jgi:hypothetical protein
MGSVPDLEHQHQFVLAAVERAHAAVGLVPDAEVFDFREHGLPGGEQLTEVPPVHAHERNGAIPAAGGGMTEGQLQEAREGLPRHLSGPMANSRWRIRPSPHTCPSIATL